METRKNHSERMFYRPALMAVLIGLLGGLSGCSTVKNVSTMMVDTPVSSPSSIRFDIPVSKDRTEQFLTAAYDGDSSGNSPYQIGLSRDEALAMGCNLRDRFDGSAALTYRMDDDQSRLSLHMNTGGGGGAMIRFTKTFGEGKKADDRAHCRVPSKIQGIIGTAYNELVRRNTYTIGQELRERLHTVQ